MVLNSLYGESGDSDTLRFSIPTHRGRDGAVCVRCPVEVKIGSGKLYHLRGAGVVGPTNNGTDQRPSERVARGPNGC